jgi:hypothetical protein
MPLLVVRQASMDPLRYGRRESVAASNSQRQGESGLVCMVEQFLPCRFWNVT